VPGTTQTFVIDYVGSPVYPSTPSAAQQNYDFVFRFAYKDGKESTKQIRIETVATERSAVGTYDYDPFFGEYYYKENSTSLDLVDPSAPSAASSMTIGLAEIGASLSGNPEIRFYIKPPEATVLPDWRGVRVRYRKVILGTDPDFETYTSTDVQINAISGNHFLPLAIDYDSTYEFVLTPLYANSGVRTDSTESLFMTGYVHKKQTRDDYPSDGNWLSSFNVQAMTTAKALKQIDEAFPAPPDPFVEVTEWKILNKDSWKGQNDPFAYYKLTFNHHAVADFTQLNIYRRSNAYGRVTDTYGTFYGKGRWEKVDITSVESSPDSTTVFLRPPLTEAEYNPYYQIGGTQSLRRSFAEQSTNGYGPRDTDEFLLVVEGSSGEADVGIFLQGGNGSGSTVDLLLGVRPQVATVSDFNQLNSVLEKNLSQAITAFTLANTSKDVKRGSKWSDNAVSTTPAIE
jgi:hypothetical protein